DLHIEGSRTVLKDLQNAPASVAGVFDVDEVSRRLTLGDGAEVDFTGVEDHVLAGMSENGDGRGGYELRPDGDVDGDLFGAVEAGGVHVDAEFGRFIGLQDFRRELRFNATAFDTNVGDFERHLVDVDHLEGLLQLRAPGDGS